MFKLCGEFKSQRFFKRRQETMKSNKEINDEWIFFSFVGGWGFFNKNEIMVFIYSETNLEIEKI